ncbi:MAG: SurA N-terminal domain-containing protein [Pirellulaceae bacterium]|nr:SurA N-terminal domain-containing protein [Pirellulaceae bacterium]
MASPFTLLRKHQRALLAVFGVAIILVFVVGTSLSQFANMGPGGSRGRDANVAFTWKHGEVTNEELNRMVTKHNVTMNFLGRVVEETQKREGFPKARLLRRAASEADYVTHLVMADKARAEGMAVSDKAVKDYLAALSDEMLSEAEFSDILGKIAPNWFTEQHLFEQLKQELMANSMRTIAADALYSVIPPSGLWEYHQRLARRVQADIYPLEVNSFEEQVGEPTDSQLAELYDKGKDRYPSPFSGEPGFRRGHQYAFAYATLDFNKYLEDEKAKLTEEELKTEYDANIEKGMYRVTPPVITPETQDPDGKDGEEKKDGEDRKDPADEGAKKDDPAPDKPSEEKKGDEKKPDEASSEKKEEPPAPPTEDAPDSKSESKKDDAKSDKPGDQQSRREPIESAIFVAAQAADDEKAEPDAKKDDPKKTDPKADDPKKTDTKADDTKEGDTKPTIEKPKFQPLEEVRDELATSLASEKAGKRVKAAIAAITKAVGDHGVNLRVLKNRKEGGETVVLPKEPDFGAIALEHDADDYTPLELLDGFQIADTELGRSSDFSLIGQRFRQVTFAEIAYSGEGAMYEAATIRGPADVQYVYWRFDEKPDHSPELADVRDEVTDAWKQIEAYKLAEKEAQTLADKSKSADNLADAVGGDENVARSLHFSWMTQRPTGFNQFGGGGGPELSTIFGEDSTLPLVENPGDEFMKSVFDLQVGQTGVAASQDHQHVYVVRILSEVPDRDIQREAFLEEGTMAIAMAFGDMQQGLSKWYESLSKEYDVNWQRPPQFFGR